MYSIYAVTVVVQLDSVTVLMASCQHGNENENRTDFLSHDHDGKSSSSKSETAT